MSTLDIVIVNWNTGELLRECLRSLAEADAEPVRRVVVVDNASSDGSAEELSAQSYPLEIIRNAANRGFAAACNQGAREGEADYILFLNPDTRVERDALVRSVQFLDEHERVGIVGIQLVDEHGHVRRTCARLPKPGPEIGRMVRLDAVAPRLVRPHFLTDWDHADTREVDQVMGAFFLTRRTLFERLGGFDERFFVYFEEVDFTVRARALGWSTCYLADVRAYHYGGGSSEKVEDRRLYYIMRSRLLFFAKHYSAGAALAYGVALFAVELPVRLVLAGLQRSRGSAANTIRAFRMLLDDLPAMRRRMGEPAAT